MVRLLVGCCEVIASQTRYADALSHLFSKTVIRDANLLPFSSLSCAIAASKALSLRYIETILALSIPFSLVSNWK
jgi:hypothetical protein